MYLGSNPHHPLCKFVEVCFCSTSKQTSTPPDLNAKGSQVSLSPRGFSSCAHERRSE